MPKIWTKIISKNILYKPALPGDANGNIRFKGITFTKTGNSAINNINTGNGGTIL